MSKSVQVPAGTMSEQIAAKPEVDTAPPKFLDWIDDLTNPKIKQQVASAVYASAGASVAYTLLGLVSTAASTLRQEYLEKDQRLSLAEAIDLIEAENIGAEFVKEQGNEPRSRIGRANAQLGLRNRMEQTIQEIWPEFTGRTLEEEIARTAEVREVREADVDAIFEYDDGDTPKEDIEKALMLDRKAEARRNEVRVEAALHLATFLEPIDEDQLGFKAEEELRLYTLADGALKRYGIDCITGRARGFATNIERTLTASECKKLRKEISQIVAHPRFDTKAAKAADKALVEARDIREHETAQQTARAVKAREIAEERKEDAEKALDGTVQPPAAETQPNG